MPEFNPDKIPVLEDIIEPARTPEQEPEKNNTVLTDETPPLGLSDETDENLDLLSTAAMTESDLLPEEMLPEEILPGEALSDQYNDTAEIDEPAQAQIAAIDNSDEDDTEDSLSPFSAIDDDIDEAPVILETNDDIVVCDTGSSDIQPSGDPADTEWLAPDTGDAPPAEHSFYPEPPEPVESALIDYQQTATDTSHETADDDTIISSASIAGHHVAQPTQAIAIALAPLVDDIVKQLMPELEQQLRFLVRQALHDKLPEEIIKNEDPEI